MRKRARFPKPIISFSHLPGGNYGTVDVIATTPAVMELRLGADYVRFQRGPAEALRDAIQRFLDLEAESGECRDNEDVEKHVIDDVIDAVVVAHMRDHRDDDSREAPPPRERERSERRPPPPRAR